MSRTCPNAFGPLDSSAESLASLFATIKLVEMSAGYFVLAARATYGNLYLSSCFEEVLSLEHSTASFVEKGRVRYN